MIERRVPGAGNWIWEQLTLPRAAAGDRLDVFFAPAYSGPPLPCPTVLTIHDVSYFAHPEWFRVREGMKRRWLTRRAARHARVVITVSEFSRDEIVTWLGLPASRVEVIVHGADAAEAFEAGAVDHTRPAPRTRDTVLYVGSIFNRRHVPDLIHAFAPIAREHPTAALELVGDNRSFPFEDLRAIIERVNLPGQVTWRRYVGDQELARLYREARAFAFLSEYEGFGLTPLEALAAGVPPVLLDTRVARETCGAAALYVPPRNLTATTTALRQLLFDEGVRHRIDSEAPAVLDRYHWRAAATRTLDVIERVALG